MSLGNGPMSSKRWRPWEQIGWGLGVAAGAVAPPCLWAFTIAWHIGTLVVRPKRMVHPPGHVGPQMSSERTGLVHPEGEPSEAVDALERSAKPRRRPS